MPFFLNGGDYEKVNISIEKFIRTSWILSDTTSILSTYDEQVLNEVREIYHEAINIPVDWINDSLEEILSRFTKSHKQNHPYLSEKAIQNLFNCFLYQWK